MHRVNAGEWKGEFSDHSDAWEKLLENKQHDSQDSTGVSDLERTMLNDGYFWISYDDFLLGFSNVDVVLAFSGNCARSFQCNFPEKYSNHRTTRAFVVSLLDPQPGVPSRDTVELYVMGVYPPLFLLCFCWMFIFDRLLSFIFHLIL